MKKTVSVIMLALLILSMLTLAFNPSFVKAVADPVISGTVRDKLGNPIPNVLIVAQDALTEIDVASATSNATGAYIMTVPPSTYNLIVTPPPESEFGSTTITNIEVTTDTLIDIVLVPIVPTVTFSGEVLDRDGNPVPNQNVGVYSPDVGRGWGATTNDQGLFSMQVPIGNYSLGISYYYWYEYYVPNVPPYYYLSRKTAINITEDTFMTFTLQNRYLTGKVDMEGKPIPNVSIYVSGYTDFGDFSGWFEAWTTSDSQGNFNVTVFSANVSLSAWPPDPYAPVRTYIDMTEDKTVLIALAYKAGVLPTASFIWSPEIPEVGQTVTFDASTSIPGSGIIIRHKWSFGDGTYAIGKIVTHSYASPGVYTVTLNVTNSKGLWDIEQKQIQVVEPAPGPKPPVVSFTYKPPNPRVNETVTFDASESYDQDGQIVSYNWNFGDGTTGEGKIATHSYSKEGNYKVTLTVVDNDGQSSSKSKTLTVLKPKTDKRIDDAIAWALDWADGPPYPPGAYQEWYREVKYVNLCLAFVQDAYQYGASAKIQRYEYAEQAADALGAEENKGIPPPGAFVFYNWYGTIDGEYKNWGHVGLSLGDGQMVHAWTTGPVVASYDTIGLEYIGWAWPPLTPPIKTSGLSVLATCPVDLIIIDPDYLVISKEYSEIPEAVYIEEDFNGDGSPDDYVFIPERKTGEYLITVIPEPDADPTATYTLEVSSEGITFLLGENVPISDIPTEPYTFDTTPFQIVHDVAVVSVVPSATEVYIGQIVNITVIVQNEGDAAETFIVTCKYELEGVEHTIGTQTVTNLAPNTTTTLTFTWTTTDITIHTIKAELPPLPGETDTADNTLTSPTTVKVKILGDINGDGEIDMKDIATAASAFGSFPTHPRWNPICDLNGDDKIDLKDIGFIAKNFGKTPP